MDYKEAIEEAEIQIYMYESMILYNKDFEPKNDNSNYERKMDFLKTVISAMQELMEYKQLGTLEEVREAVEKQKVDKVIESDYMGSSEVWYRCPNCKGDLTHIRGFFCPYCGKRLDWRCDEE